VVLICAAARNPIAIMRAIAERIACLMFTPIIRGARGIGWITFPGVTLRSDETWMRLALEDARAAGVAGDVPVGAVIVRRGDLVTRASNRTVRDNDPTGHAELLAIREAARKLADWRLTGCTLFVTLEPCAMCAGAIVLARLDRVVFGAYDDKAGMAGLPHQRWRQ